jgi:hypothetical protein
MIIDASLASRQHSLHEPLACTTTASMHTSASQPRVCAAVQASDINELLLLGDPIILAASDDMPDSSAAGSSSQEVQSNAALLAGLAQELQASGRVLLVHSYQDAVQRCPLGFKVFYVVKPCVLAGEGGARQLVMRRLACAEQLLPLDAMALMGRQAA